jgi:hypothetical protein
VPASPFWDPKQPSLPQSADKSLPRFSAAPVLLPLTTAEREKKNRSNIFWGTTKICFRGVGVAAEVEGCTVIDLTGVYSYLYVTVFGAVTDCESTTFPPG